MSSRGIIKQHGTARTRRIRLIAFSLATVTIACLMTAAPSSAQPDYRAARSVHLVYYAPKAVLFYNEVTVQNVVPGSYFMVAGFGHGYFGIQELSPHNRRVLFSVWDAGTENDRVQHKPDQQVNVIAKGEGVAAGRFGGEGTGAQSYMAYPWKEGETYRFVVKAEVKDRRTEFSGYFYDNEKKKWRLLSTLSTPANGSLLRGLYSFVEDFRRDRRSIQERRCAYFGNGWVKTPKGEWVEITKAIFTADGTQLDNIQGGISGTRFTIATGGESRSIVRLYENLAHRPSGNKPPSDLPSFIDPDSPRGVESISTAK